MNSFQNLSLALEDMPTTRSQRARGRGRGGARGRGGPAASHGTPTPPGPVQGHSGLFYNLRDMSPPSAARAALGINADFFVDRVRRHESERGAYFAFQLNRPVSVRIYNPVERGQEIECTCEEFQTSRAICIHIYVRIPNPSRKRLTHSILVAVRWTQRSTRYINIFRE